MNRRWLYGGLAVQNGVGLVTKVSRGPRLVPGTTRLLVVGGAFAAGLAPALRVLARDQKVAFEAVLAPGHPGAPLRTEDWALRPELRAALATFKPTLVAVALDVPALDRPGRARQAAALKALVATLKAAGAEVVWIGPPVRPAATQRPGRPEPRYFPTGTALTLPRGPDGIQPSVAGYAGWAGALWQWLS
jgi:hypothetical protein